MSSFGRAPSDLVIRCKNCFPPFKDEGEVTASWGEAQLINYLDGKLVLKCGSKEDRIAAKEWISMFLNDVVVRKIGLKD
jgi:hypothetical protein